MSLFGNLFGRKKKRSPFMGWVIKDIIESDRIETVLVDGAYRRCVSPLQHFAEYARFSLLGNSDMPYAPSIESEEFNVYFFPTFCVAEFNAGTDGATFIVFAPDQDSPQVAQMIVESLAAVAMEHETAMFGDVADFLADNLPPEMLR